jgi:hypothetical protein
MARLKLGGARTRSLCVLGLLCVGCPTAPSDGPPPAERLEIASAAPRALGALAGGTNAAPHAFSGPGAPSRAGADDPPDPDGDEDDAGAAPTPDAGSSSPEDIPL